MATPNSVHFADPALASAVKDSSKEKLEFVLSVILQKHPDAVPTALGLLDEVPAGLNRSEITTGSAQEPGKKRKRFETCAQCQHEYDTERNNDKACNWHRGMSKAAMTLLLELGVICHRANICVGRIESNDENDDGPINAEFVDMFPDAFVWNCCDKSGADKVGCVISEHSTQRL